MTQIQPDFFTLAVGMVSWFLSLSFASTSNHEAEVNQSLECTAGQAVCTDFSRCIPSDFICDGIMDCDDGSDERITLCYYRNFTCSGSEGIQIRSSLRCDGYINCPDGSDEVNCEKRTTKSKLLSTLFSSSLSLPLETVEESDELLPTTSSSVLREDAETNSNNISVAVESDVNVGGHVPPNHLDGREKTGGTEYLGPLMFWLTIFIGLLAVLAIVTLVAVHVSFFFKNTKV